MALGSAGLRLRICSSMPEVSMRMLSKRLSSCEPDSPASRKGKGSPSPAVWKVGNDGTQPHHMILFGVPDGTTEDEFMTALKEDG